MPHQNKKRADQSHKKRRVHKFETQTHQDCAKHAVNNLLQSSVLTSENLKEVSRKDTLWSSIDVSNALERFSPKHCMKPIYLFCKDNPDHHYIFPIVQDFLSEPNPHSLPFLRLMVNVGDAHWFGILFYVNGQIEVLDSLNNGPVQVSMEYIKEMFRTQTYRRWRLPLTAYFLGPYHEWLVFWSHLRKLITDSVWKREHPPPKKKWTGGNPYL